MLFKLNMGFYTLLMICLSADMYLSVSLDRHSPLLIVIRAHTSDREMS